MVRISAAASTITGTPLRRATAEIDLRAQWTIVARPGQDVDHRRAFAERLFEIARLMHFDDLHAQHADGMIVNIARISRDDDFVLQSSRDREAAASVPDWRRRCTRRCMCVMRGAHPAVTMPQSAPVSSASRLPDAIHQFVHVHVAAGGFLHRVLHFRQRLRAADDRERAAALIRGRTPIDV